MSGRSSRVSRKWPRWFTCGEEGGERGGEWEAVCMCMCVCVCCVLVCTHACAHTCICVIISESHCHLTWNCCSCPSTVLPETDRTQQSEQLQSEIRKLEACSGLTVHTHTHTCCNTYCPYTGCHHGDWLTATCRPTAGYAMSILQIVENDSVGSNFTIITHCATFSAAFPFDVLHIQCVISLWEYIINIKPTNNYSRMKDLHYVN